MRSDSGKSLVPDVPGDVALELCAYLWPSAGWRFVIFCQKRVSTVKYTADHTSPCPVELCFNLLLRSCSGKPLLCKVRPPRYIHAHTPFIQCPHTYPSMHIYLPIYLSIHPFHSRLSDLLPSNNQPALKGKTVSFISINHSPLHYHRYISRPPA